MEYTGYALTRRFEGLRLEAYQDVVGVWTIGYGHTKGVRKGDKITQAQADEFLREDVQESVDAVNRLVRVHIGQNQFDALVDFTFNLGVGNLSKSTLLKLLNTGDYVGAWKEFPKWNRAGGSVVAGLTRRREDEAKLFMS